jgi:anaerobic magnesium-protoporphyrin IX monomethyl ester cyclase
MKVGLIYLPHPYLGQPDAQAPLGLMYLAAVLEESDIECEIFNFSSSHTHEALQKLTECDIYGITVTSFELPQANRFAYLIKELYPNAKVILGGPGTYSIEFIDREVIDSVCIGDGEITILQMCIDFNLATLQKTYQGKSVPELDKVPFPARHKLESSQGGNIFAYNKQYKGTESTILITSRGCPFKCAFCSSPYFTKTNKGVRYRSAENIRDEIVHVQKQYGVQQFRISDDMFMSNKKRVYEICELIGPLDIAWRISTRVKPFDEELVKVMYQAGCKEVSFGVESFDNHVLKVLKKGTTAEDNALAIETAKKIGMDVRVLFMIKTPGQRKETVPLNIEWLERLPYDIIACTTFIPIPGCDIWHNPQDYGVTITDRNLDHYNFYFFGKLGENKVQNIISFNDRDNDEVNKETQQFREYLKSAGKVNRG